MNSWDTDLGLRILSQAPSKRGRRKLARTTQDITAGKLPLSPSDRHRGAQNRLPAPRARTAPALARSLLIEELRHSPTDEDQHRKDDPSAVHPVDGGEVIAHHREDQRHGHIGVLLRPKARG